MKRYQEEMRNIRKYMKADHDKKMREAIKQARAEILNNGSAGGTNGAVPDLSMPSPMSESFDEKNTRMTGIDCKDKDRDEEKMRRDMIEEVAKIVRDEFCATLQHRSEAMRKDNGRMTRKAL